MEYQKLWRLVKQLNDEDNQRVATLIENGDIVTCKQAANISDKFEDVSNNPVNMKHQTEARQKQGKRKFQKVTSDHMKECLTLSDVQTAAVTQYQKSLQDQMESHMKC